MEHYKKHHIPSGEDLDRIHVEFLGEYKGYKFWLVDGSYVRDSIEIDFIEGGNPGRYGYVPEDEIWIEKIMAPKDQLSTMVHEFIEMKRMENKHWDYDKAHNYSSNFEEKIRKSLPDKLPPNISLFNSFKNAIEQLKIKLT
jgi:hypothetical protein